MTMSSFIPEIWNERLLRALAGPLGQLPELSESERQWCAYRAANHRRVEIPQDRMSAIDATNAILSAAEGLQNTSVEWGDEMSGPAVEGYVQGTACGYLGLCGKLLGHPGKHG